MLVICGLGGGGVLGDQLLGVGPNWGNGGSSWFVVPEVPQPFNLHKPLLIYKPVHVHEVSGKDLIGSDLLRTAEWEG